MHLCMALPACLSRDDCGDQLRSRSLRLAPCAVIKERSMFMKKFKSKSRSNLLPYLAR